MGDVRIAPDAQASIHGAARRSGPACRLCSHACPLPDVSGAKPLRGNLAGHYRVQFTVSGRAEAAV